MYSPLVSWIGYLYKYLPWFLRTPKRIAFIRCGFVQLQWLHNNFLQYRSDVLFKIRYTGQVIYMEHMLNAKFNNDQPAYTAGVPSGIYISDGNSAFIAPFIFKKPENGPLWSFKQADGPPTPPGKLWLLTKAQIQALNIDFVVNVPVAVGDVNNNTFLSEIKAWVDLYKQAGKNYTVVNYTP